VERSQLQATGGLPDDQKQMVRTTFALIEPLADQAAAIFYSRLFAIAPELLTTVTWQERQPIPSLMCMPCSPDRVLALDVCPWQELQARAASTVSPADGS